MIGQNTKKSVQLKMNAFDQQKYIKLQSEKILERVSKFKKLYLEFGGKLFDDHHISRCLPGFDPDTKIKMLLNIKEKVEVIITIAAEDIESGKRRHDVGISYEDYTIQLIESFKDVGLLVNSVVINKFDSQPSVITYKRKLEQRSIKVHLFNKIMGYPTNVDLVLSDRGFGVNPFIQTTKPIVLITSPGAKSGKMGVGLSQLYHEAKNGNKKAGFAKFETVPVWNLPLRHPLNIAYEASTVNINDVNVIDHYHFEKYGVVAVNYNRDIEAFPLLQNIFRHIYGKDIYHSPTDMGVNMVGFCINDNAAVEAACKQEIIRRYFETLCYFKQGKVGEDTVSRMVLLMKQLSLNPTDRGVVVHTAKLQEKESKHSASIQLSTGEILSATANGFTSASSELLLKAVGKLLSLNSKIRIIPDNIMQKTTELKTQILGEKRFHLRLGEILVILASSAVTNELSAHALDAIKQLKGAEVHTSYMISDEESMVWKRLGVNLTQEPVLG